MLNRSEEEEEEENEPRPDQSANYWEEFEV